MKNEEFLLFITSSFFIITSSFIWRACRFSKGEKMTEFVTNNNRLKYLFILYMAICLSFAYNGTSDAKTEQITGSIKGTVKNLTTDKVAPQQEVILKIFRGDAGEGNQDNLHNKLPDEVSIVSDSTGSFEFSQLQIAPTLSYRLTTYFQDADYSSQPIRLTPERPEKTVELGVYSSSDDDSNIQTTAHHLIIEPIGENVEMSSRLQITEYIILNNSGKTSYLASSPQGKRFGLKLDLPHGFDNFKPMQGLMECCVTFDGNTLLYSHATLPNAKTIIFTYQMPASKRVNLSRRLSFNTYKLLALVAGEGSQFTSNVLIASDKAQMQGRTYTKYLANNLIKGQVLDIQLELPSKRRFNPVWLSGIVLAVGLAAILVVRRFSTSRGSDDARVDDSEPAESSAETEIGDLKKGYLELISRLDEIHEAGEISEVAYKKIRDEQKSKLSEVMNK